MSFTFTIGELHEELGALGYGGVPDDIIFSTMSELQLENPSLSNESKFAKSNSFNSGVRGSKASRQIHGSPVPGDREFCKPKKYGRSRSALHSVCFTSDFAKELDEMRKMLKIMEGAKHELFGLQSARTSSGKRMALADEHEQYVSNLKSQWRLVGKTIRGKRNDSPAVTLNRSENSSGASSSEVGEFENQFEQKDSGCAQLNQDGAEAHTLHRDANEASELKDSPTAFRGKQDAPKTSLEQQETPQVLVEPHHSRVSIEQRNVSESKLEQQCAVQTLELQDAFQTKVEEKGQEALLGQQDASQTKVEEKGQETLLGPQDASDDQLDLQDVVPAYAESATGTEIGVPDESDECDLLAVNASLCDSDDVSLVEEFESEDVKELVGKENGRNHARDNGLTSAVEDVRAGTDGYSENVEGEENKLGGAFRRQKSGSAISPGVSYQQGGMLYPENFIDLKYDDDDLLSNEDGLPPKHHEECPQSPEHIATAELGTISALSNGQFLAALEKSLQDVDPQETIGEVTFANATHKTVESSSNLRCSFSDTGSRPSGSENPPDLAVPALGTPNPRVGRHHSPLNDRSNIHTVEDSTHPQNPRSKAVFRITELNSAVTLKRSRSSREPRRLEKADANGTQHLSDITEDRVDSWPSTKTTPPPSARKARSEKVLGHSLSEKFSSSRVTIRKKGASDSSHLDIAALGLSPIRVREPASPLKLSGSERPCGVNGSAEHRHGTCTVCPSPSVRKSGDSSSSNAVPGSKSPFGKSVGSSTASSESEVSPKQQKPTLRKRSGPSGIYTPLVDQQKPDVISKVFLKSARPSSVDFTSESSRQTYRRGLSLRSSAESTKSPGGVYRSSTMTQDSKSNSLTSPLARNSPSTNSFGSHGTSREKGTAVRPMWAGKVDRVARVLEDMRPQSEAPPFVVPSSQRERVKSHRAFS